MPKQPSWKKNHTYRPVFFREWREFLKLTQEQVAERIGTTKSRVSVKETSEEPYDQCYLEVFCDALSLEIGAVVSGPPSTIDAEIEALHAILRQASPDQRETIKKVAKALIIKEIG